MGSGRIRCTRRMCRGRRRFAVRGGRAGAVGGVCGWRGGDWLRWAREFCFDNETPRHKVYLEPYRLASRPVSCGEYLAFMEDGGYKRSELWLSEGWNTVRSGGLGGSAVLAARRKRVGGFHAARICAAEGSGCNAGLPHQLFRGGCVRALGGKGAADRSGVGDGGCGGFGFGEFAGEREAPSAGADSAHPTRSKAPLSNFTVTFGSGPSALIFLIRAITRSLARWASTTANSCATRWCCAGDRWRHRLRTFARAYRNFFAPATRWQFSGVRLAEH